MALSGNQKVAVVQMLMSVMQHTSKYVMEMDNNDDDDLDELIRLGLRPDRRPMRGDSTDKESIIHIFSDSTFRNHFRISRRTFEWIKKRLAPHPYSDVRGRPPLGVEKQLLATLWMLGNQETYRAIADRFDMSKSTLWAVFLRMVTQLCGLSSTVIVWPSAARMERIEAKFKMIAGVPDVIGVIDATHIPIKGPRQNSDIYVNQRGFHSFILQAVCDYDKRFLDCYAECPGSMQNDEVLCRSELISRIRSDQETMIGEFCILGDETYNCDDIVITPFGNDGNLTTRQQIFNLLHSKTTHPIQNAFGLLKGRFRRLEMLSMARIDLVPNIILATCVIHNICVEQFEDSSDLADCYDDKSTITVPYYGTGKVDGRKREKMMNELVAYSEACAKDHRYSTAP